MKRLTNQQFINKAKLVHGNKYDYKKVKYINSQTKITIICKIHGDFLQIPSAHLCGQNCKKCYVESQKLTNQQFIDRANKIHNFKYDYSKVEYINSKTKVKIICPQHGEFLQNPSSHLEKRNCIKCTNNIPTIQEFIDKANKIHNNKYNYSKTNYINNYTKIIIICKKHGEFLQTPHSHLNKNGCPACGGNKKLSIKKFIKRANQTHNFKYDYSKVKYKNVNNKIIIICPTHGEFLQIIYDHLTGKGCINCRIEKSILTNQQFIDKANKIHKNKYDYSKTNYIRSNMKTIIICKKHGKFSQTPNSHLQGKGCFKCSRSTSMGETKWLNKIEKENNIKIIKNLTIYINNQQFRPDGFCKKTNTWYEYNGYFIHGHPDYYNPNDINKMIKKTFGELYQKTLEKERLIKSAGYNLITKWGK